MALVVQKFGGTSVADIDRLRAVAGRIKAAHRAGDRLAVVVSAMAGTTDQLVRWVTEIGGPRYDPAEYDVVVASGEQVTCGLLALALQAEGVPARSFLGWQMPLETDAGHGRARIRTLDPSAVRAVPGAGPGRDRGRLSRHRARPAGQHARPRRLGHLGGRARGRARRRPL